MQDFISDKVLKFNELFYASGCKFIADGRVRYYGPNKDSHSNIICNWVISLGTIDGVEGTKYEKCVNITVNSECKSTIRIYTNVLKIAPPSMADAEIKYEVSYMTYSAISGNTFELVYKMNQALVEQMREFLEDCSKTNLTETESDVTAVKESKPKSKKTTKSTTKSTKTKKG